MSTRPTTAAARGVWPRSMSFSICRAHASASALLPKVLQYDGNPLRRTRRDKRQPIPDFDEPPSPA